MEDTEIELLLGREMPHTGHKRLPERPIIGPFGKNFVDGAPAASAGKFTVSVQQGGRNRAKAVIGGSCRSQIASTALGVNRATVVRKLG